MIETDWQGGVIVAPIFENRRCNAECKGLPYIAWVVFATLYVMGIVKGGEFGALLLIASPVALPLAVAALVVQYRQDRRKKLSQGD